MCLMHYCVVSPGTELPTDDEAKLTPLHFSARYIPRYYDEDNPMQDTDEAEVTTLSSSKQAVKFLVTFCRVDVSLDVFRVLVCV